MKIGIRDLGAGHPEAFWHLSREQQLNTLAVLQVEMFLAEEDPKDRASWEKRVPVQVEGSPDAINFWSEKIRMGR